MLWNKSRNIDAKIITYQEQKQLKKVGKEANTDNSKKKQYNLGNPKCKKDLVN